VATLEPSKKSRNLGAVPAVHPAKTGPTRVAHLGPGGAYAQPRRLAAPPTQPEVAPGVRPMGTPSSAAAEPLYRKGLWYQRQGQIEQAIAMYEEALRLSPNHSAAGSALLSATLETDAFDKACTLGTELHARHPEDHRVALNLAIALVGCARPKEAISLLDRQAALPEPRLFEIFFHKGVAYRQLGEGAKAVEQYRKAEAMRPWDSRLMFNLALAFEREADYPEAIRYYRKCLVVLPPSEVRMRDRVGRRVALLEDNIGVSGPAHRETP
jgi:tetratricopeptide (TPR) repeat protein